MRAIVFIDNERLVAFDTVACYNDDKDPTAKRLRDMAPALKLHGITVRDCTVTRLGELLDYAEDLLREDEG